MADHQSLDPPVEAPGCPWSVLSLGPAGLSLLPEPEGGLKMGGRFAVGQIERVWGRSGMLHFG